MTSLSHSDLRFIKTYHKKNYQKDQDIAADEFDIVKRQAPLKIFNKVNKEKGTTHKYKFFAHKRKIYSFLPKLEAIKLEETVIELNDYEKNKALA